MKKQTIIWTIVFLIIITQVLALGIRPAKTTLEFEPNTAKQFSFKIVNNDNQDLDISISIQGSLEGIIETSKTQIHLNPDQEFIEIPFTIYFPDTLTSDSETKINIQQAISGYEQIGAKINLVHRLIIKVPSPAAPILEEPALEQPISEPETEEITKEPIAKPLNMSEQTSLTGQQPINIIPIQITIIIAAIITIFITLFIIFKKRKK